MRVQKKPLNIYYDKEADVLYVSHGKPSARDETFETEDEIVVRKNPKNGTVTGFTILHFLKRGAEGPTITLPFQFSFH